MEESGIWWVTLEIDRWIREFCNLDSDSEIANFARGFTRGLNAGSLRADADSAQLKGYDLGKSVRDRAEEAHQRAVEAGRKGGRKSQQNCGTAKLIGKNSISSDLPIAAEDGSKGSSEDASEGGSTSLGMTNKQRTRKENRKPKEIRAGQESLEDILGGGKGTSTWDGYWELVGLFGPAKNPAPKETARLYMSALSTVQMAEILGKAKDLLQSVENPKYLPQLSKWLGGEGYRNPDAVAIRGNVRGPRAVNHRSECDATYLKELQDKPRPNFESFGGVNDVPGVQ